MKSMVLIRIDYLSELLNISGVPNMHTNLQLQKVDRKASGLKAQAPSVRALPVVQLNTGVVIASLRCLTLVATLLEYDRPLGLICLYHALYPLYI